MNTDKKSKLTLSINTQTLQKAKKTAQQHATTLSKLVENFLDFYSDPWLYCFTCGKKFRASQAEVCPKCGWLICPHCGSCRCSLDDQTAASIYHMRKVYEDLLQRRLK